MPRAIRLVITRGEDGNLELVRYEPLEDIVLPDSDALADDEAVPVGLFLEARSSDEKLLTERSIDLEDFASIEFPTGDPQRPLARVATPRGLQRSYLFPTDAATARIAMVRRWHDQTELNGLHPLGVAPIRSDELFSIDLGPETEVEP